MIEDKLLIQESLYEFPYHYLPYLDHGGGAIKVSRQLAWGLEYMTYLSFLVDLIMRLSPRSLLDVGCGDGRLINMIKPSIPVVRGIHLSFKALSFAQAFNPEVRFTCGDVSDISEKYQVATCIEVLEHIPDNAIHSFIKDIANCIEAKGWLIISVPTVNVPLNKKHYRHYSFETLQTLVSSHFEIEKHWWLYRKSTIERLLRLFLCNRLFITNNARLRSLIWKMHKRMTYNAGPSNGSHLVCLAKPK